MFNSQHLPFLMSLLLVHPTCHLLFLIWEAIHLRPTKNTHPVYLGKNIIDPGCKCSLGNTDTFKWAIKFTNIPLNYSGVELTRSIIWKNKNERKIPVCTQYLRECTQLHSLRASLCSLLLSRFQIPPTVLTASACALQMVLWSQYSLQWNWRTYSLVLVIMINIHLASACFKQDCLYHTHEDRICTLWIIFISYN